MQVGHTVISCHARIPGPPRDIVLGVRPGDIAADGQGLPAEVYVSEPRFTHLLRPAKLLAPLYASD
jgi:hypothetical protein